MRKFGRWILGFVLLLALAVGGFVIWGNTPLKPMPEAIAALQSDSHVQVKTSPWLVFRPLAGEPEVGFVFYPGGRVDLRAYAPAAHAIAAQGYLVVIVPMPLNLAVLDPGRANRVISAFPAIQRWAIGGHSLGGAMAANFAYNHPEAIQGLVLWAAYPAGSNDLSERNLAVVSIYGTLDGLATGDKISASRALLPPTTRWVGVEGGNHAQFGWYGLQAGDGTASIDRAIQQEQVILATLELLSLLKDKNSQ